VVTGGLLAGEWRRNAASNGLLQKYFSQFQNRHSGRDCRNPKPKDGNEGSTSLWFRFRQFVPE
jgi:hypothetical protein